MERTLRREPPPLAAGASSGGAERGAARRGATGRSAEAGRAPGSVAAISPRAFSTSAAAAHDTSSVEPARRISSCVGFWAHGDLGGSSCCSELAAAEGAGPTEEVLTAAISLASVAFSSADATTLTTALGAAAISTSALAAATTSARVAALVRHV